MGLLMCQLAGVPVNRHRHICCSSFRLFAAPYLGVVCDTVRVRGRCIGVQWFCTWVYWQVYWVTGGSVGKLRQSRQRTSLIITTLPYARSLNQLLSIKKNFHQTYGENCTEALEKINGDDFIQALQKNKKHVQMFLFQKMAVFGKKNCLPPKNELCIPCISYLKTLF